MSKLTFGEPINKPAGSKAAHAYGNKVRNHYGIDYPAEKGWKIVASERGVVVKAGYNFYLGNVIIIDHNPEARANKPHIYTIYGHLRDKRIKEGPFAVKVGDTVKKGQHIGYCGDTGNSGGDHLHFGVAHLSKKAEGKG